MRLPEILSELSPYERMGRKLARNCAAALLVLSLTSPSYAEKGKCEKREGYQLFVKKNDKKNAFDLIGQKAPAIFQKDVNSRSPTYQKFTGPQDYKGKIVILNYWASWCSPCIRELPLLEKVHNSHDDVIVLALESSAKSDWRQTDISDFTFPVLAREGKVPFSMRVCEKIDTPQEQYSDHTEGTIDDLSGYLANRYVYGSAGTLPSSFFIDKSGIVREVHKGRFKTVEEIEEIVKKYK